MFNFTSSSAAWESGCAEIDRIEPGWRWEDVLNEQPTLAADCDAIRVSEVAIDELPHDWPNWMHAVRADGGQAPTGESSGAAAKAHSLSDRVTAASRLLGSAVNPIAHNQRLTELPLNAIRAVITAAGKAREKVLHLVDLSAGRAPDGPRPVLAHIPNDSMLKVSLIATLLRLHALQEAEDGRPDEAIADGRAILGSARAAAEPPMLFTAILAFANRLSAVAAIERTLAQGEPGRYALEAAQRDVHEAAEASLALRAFRGERALHEEFICAVDAEAVTRKKLNEMEAECVAPWTGVSRIDRLRSRIWRGIDDKLSSARATLFHTRIIELLRVSPDEPKRRANRIAAVERETGRSVMRRLWGCARFLEAERRQRAALRSLAAALAAERFRMTTDRWPDALDELVPEYLETVPTDPFVLCPLRYRKAQDGVVIYLLGPDEHDGGGQVRVYAGKEPTSADVGVRLWNVASRGQ
jgi:hypothetical protein